MALRHRRRLATRPGVIMVDGVYTNGAVARMAEVVEVAEASGSVLVVDETHSFGVAPGGLGVCEEAGVVDRVHFRAIGLSKACASRGGELPRGRNPNARSRQNRAPPTSAPTPTPTPTPSPTLAPTPSSTPCGSPGVVVGPSRALEALRFVDRGLIFSTPPLEHEIVGYNATLDVLLRDEWRREKLHATHAKLQQGLLALGYEDDIARSERQSRPSQEQDQARPPGRPPATAPPRPCSALLSLVFPPWRLPALRARPPHQSAAPVVRKPPVAPRARPSSRVVHRRLRI